MITLHIYPDRFVVTSAAGTQLTGGGFPDVVVRALQASQPTILVIINHARFSCQSFSVMRAK